jgi:hypothetical protein
VQLTERCRAYDRRYVQCIFRAPTIARAFRNGFPRLYKFSELNPEYIFIEIKKTKLFLISIQQIILS